MPYAVGYARFSSVKQGSGSSLERQQAMIAKWIDTNPEYKIFPKNFEDLGRSASKGDHLKHVFGMLLQAIELKAIGEGDVILVEAIDRIGRLHETKNDLIDPSNRRGWRTNYHTSRWGSIWTDHQGRPNLVTCRKSTTGLYI